MTSTDNTIRTRIIELLEVYPKLSPTMLQSGLGPSLYPKIWRPVFDALVEEGVITEEAVIPPLNKERTRPYRVVQLSRNVDIAHVKVPPPPGRQLVTAA